MIKTLSKKLRAELPLKLLLLVVLNAVVWIPYQTLQRIHFFPATLMPASFIDDAIPFSPAAVWAYLSIYLLMPIGPFQFTDRQKLIRYAQGVVFMSALAAVVFIFFPTTCARPDSPSANAAYRALITIDNPYHSFPSLHAAFAIYSALCATTVAPKFKIIFCLWTGLILYATIATRQHVLIDLIAGGLLGFAAFQIFLKRPQPANILQPAHITP